MPRTPVDGIMTPKLDKGIRGKFFTGLTLRFSEWWQARNATLSDSFFYNGGAREEKERSLESLVNEWNAGGFIGYGSFSLTYLRALRSDEFKDQIKEMDYGMITLTFGRVF